MLLFTKLLAVLAALLAKSKCLLAFFEGFLAKFTLVSWEYGIGYIRTVPSPKKLQWNSPQIGQQVLAIAKTSANRQVCSTQESFGRVYTLQPQKLPTLRVRNRVMKQQIVIDGLKVGILTAQATFRACPSCMGIDHSEIRTAGTHDTVYQLIRGNFVLC